MSQSRSLIDAIRQNLARKSSGLLRQIVEADGRGRWSPEATVAARELLADRRAGRVPEPEHPEPDDAPPEVSYDPDAAAVGALAGLFTGFIVIPYTVTREVEAPDEPIPFGRRMAWLAVDAPDTAAVVRAVGLRDSADATWAEGMEAAHDGAVYVTPPVAEWTLALGTPFFRPPDALAAAVKPLVEGLSRQFGDAHYYCNHRDIGLYAWARASGGKLVRGYGWLGAQGQTVWDEGEPTEEEQSLGFRCGVGPPTVDLGDGSEPTPLGEDNVLELASVWSIDPSTLDGEFKEPGLGVLGRLADNGTWRRPHR